VPSVIDLRDKVRGWFRREPRVVVPRCVMILASNTDARATAARLIESLGYEAAQVSTIGAAMSRLETDRAQFVLLGFDLEDASGLEALSKLRELHPEVPIAMLAADLWDTRVAEAMRRGAVAYLAPPYGQDDLRELLGRR
jgi:DNA-binding NtrC family response regulator